MAELSNRKRVRDDSDEFELDSAEVKRLREDLLGNLDDSVDPDLCTVSPDLVSFMKSFEEEISASLSPSPPVAVVDLISVSGESQPEFGYLLEASDDELGLPPTSKEGSNEVTELVLVSSDSSEQLSEFWRFEDQISSFDSFEFGISGDGENYNNGEYVALDGLFDYSDLGFASYDAPVPLWRPETRPSL